MFYHQASSQSAPRNSALWNGIVNVERRQWWLWAFAILVTLLLTVGIASFSFLLRGLEPRYSFTLNQSLRGLAGLVLLFDIYIIYQQLRIHRIYRELNDREKIFRQIGENADDLITVTDAKGHKLYNSPSYMKSLGYAPEELLAVPIVEQIHPDDRHRVVEAGKIVFETGTTARIEYRFRHKDGRWRILESTLTPTKNARGDSDRLISVSRDITERRRAEEVLRQREEQLRQAQKMEAVGRLSGGIAHDFNNLLGVIIGYSETIEMRVPDGDPVRKSAEEIRKAGQRAAGLTRQLLAFSRQQVLQPTILDLNALVADMGAMLRRLIGADIDLVTKLDSGPARVKADQSQIEQVIVNLVVNARDAMPDGGKLFIETSHTFLDETMARSLPFLRTGPHVLLSVRDTGSGMDAETQAHIFEPFFTTKPRGKGTGLGLATVYGVVKQSGGVVGVSSEPGNGSAFQVYFPQATESASDASPNEAAPEISQGSETILLVEDEAPLLQLTSSSLRESGYQVLCACDGVQGLEIAKSYEGPIHLLLTDVVMPGMDGPSLAMKISVLRPETRILFMTGHADRYRSEQKQLPPGIASLQKPFKRDALIYSVRQTLDVVAQTARK